MLQHNLSDKDYEIVRSILLPIQGNIPIADNKRGVTMVLLMATCAAIEHAHFDTPMLQDATFEPHEDIMGLEIFSREVNQKGDVKKASAIYLDYLLGDYKPNEAMETTPTKPSFWNRVKTFVVEYVLPFLTDYFSNKKKS